MNLIQFQFDNKEQMNIFIKWFAKEGFESLLKAKANKGKDVISCISTDDKLEWGMYYELQ